ncbi:hypothetical protein Lesp02_30850 [Lentzea sp. NBRC 105346]|nr:helix-turn-helix transcriptional regulator [Lentzea sp. NBRC 105346]GLZ30896.1 hypothetical protein Lesp02_30850 [Lentzea sp. NBRC 105346]
MLNRFHPTMLERAIGRTLAGWRRERGLSLAEAGRRVGFSTAKLSMMENALQPSAQVDIMAVGYACGVPTPEWQLLGETAMWAAQRRQSLLGEDRVRFDPAQDASQIHAHVSHLRAFQGELIPAIFRTSDYTLAILKADDPLRAAVIAEQRNQARGAWQARLYEREPLVVETVVSEAALKQVVGGPRTMSAQLVHLIENSELPNVTIQVLPHDAGAYPAMGFPSPCCRSHTNCTMTSCTSRVSAEASTSRTSTTVGAARRSSFPCNR